MALRYQPATVGDIYDAAVDPNGLQRLAAIAMEAADGSSAVVAVSHPSGQLEAATHGLPDDALSRYLGHYHWINPLLQAGLARDVTRIMRAIPDVISELQFRQTEFYTDFARGIDTVLVLGMPSIPIAPKCAAEIGVHRGARVRNFSDRHINRVQTLLPHLQRALQLRRRIGNVDRANVGFAALEALAIGCVICDAAGRVVFANTAASVLEAAGDGIILAAMRHGLGASKATESRRLAALIGETAAGGCGGAMVLTVHGHARLFVLVTPLPAYFGGQPDYVLVTLRSPDARPTIDVATLWQLFRLTPAEARLALALAAGRSLADVGIEHRVSENTLRTQLASVLRKTETANQRELVRILGLLPPLHLNGDG